MVTNQSQTFNASEQPFWIPQLGQEENQRAWSDPLGYMEREAERYGGVKNFDAGEFELFDRAVRDLKDGVPQGFVRDDFYRQMHQYRSQRELEELLQSKDPGPDEDPKPLPIPGPMDSSVRVDEDEDRRCRLLTICFMPRKSTIDWKEFERQMELQEDGLNRMTPQEMLTNRAAYQANPVGMRALSTPLQEQARNEYVTTNRIKEMYNSKYGPIQGPIKLKEYLSSAAALHNPDMVAGGDYASVVDPTLPIEDRIGGLAENSSMGSQWINPNKNGNTRASRLTNHAEQQAKNNCPSVQVDLRICESMPNEPGKPISE